MSGDRVCWCGKDHHGPIFPPILLRDTPEDRERLIAAIRLGLNRVQAADAIIAALQGQQ